MDGDDAMDVDKQPAKLDEKSMDVDVDDGAERPPAGIDLTADDDATTLFDDPDTTSDGDGLALTDGLSLTDDALSMHSSAPPEDSAYGSEGEPGDHDPEQFTGQLGCKPTCIYLDANHWY